MNCLQLFYTYSKDPVKHLGWSPFAKLITDFSS